MWKPQLSLISATVPCLHIDFPNHWHKCFCLPTNASVAELPSRLSTAKVHHCTFLPEGCKKCSWLCSREHFPSATWYLQELVPDLVLSLAGICNGLVYSSLPEITWCQAWYKVVTERCEDVSPSFSLLHYEASLCHGHTYEMCCVEECS